MNGTVQLIHTELRRVAAESQRLCYMTRAKELQLEAIENLNELLEQAGKVKAGFVTAVDEDSANAMLSIEKIIKALIGELKMWVALKDEKPAEAWGFLVNAEVCARSALCVHPIGETGLNCQGYLRHLDILEHTLFPPQRFFSVGIIVEEAECSICRQEYGECDHIRGRAYMGEECLRCIKHAKLLEVSLVDNPANKHCRIISISDNDGIERDYLTWRPAPRAVPEGENSNI